MKPILKKQFGLISIICLCGFFTEGAVEGDFRYFGYDVEFHNGTTGDGGGTKSILCESINITTTPSNTFTAILNDRTLSRSITNHPVVLSAETPDLRLYNAYTVEISSESGSVGGSISIDSNLLLTVVPEGEDPFPFYFNSTTNVALTQSCSEQSAGVGLMVRKGSDMDNSFINGTYIRYTLGNIFKDQETYGWGYVDNLSLEQSTMVFDGMGNYSENTENKKFSRRTNQREVDYGGWHTVIDTHFDLTDVTTDSSSNSFTYSVQSDGTLNVSTGSGSIETQLSPDGNLIASSLCVDQGNYSAGAYITVAVKQPQNMTTNAISAVYFFMEFGEDFSGDSPDSGLNNNDIETGRSYIYLRSDGTFSLRTDWTGIGNQMDNTHFMIDEDPVSGNVFSTDAFESIIELQPGTYSIATNGVITLTFNNGESGQGQLSENGEYLIASYSETDSDYAGHGLIFGVRRSLPDILANSAKITLDSPVITPTGISVAISTPTNYPTEIIYTSDLLDGWKSGGIFTNATGSLEFNDPSTNTTCRFYSATEAPW